MKTPETPADVLENALEYINTLGWTQNSYQQVPDGPVCSSGALILGVVNEGVTDFDVADKKLARDGYGGRWQIYSRARDFLSKAIALSGNGYGIVSFNDDPATKKSKVVAVFKEAIKVAKNGDS